MSQVIQYLQRLLQCILVKQLLRFDVTQVYVRFEIKVCNSTSNTVWIQLQPVHIYVPLHPVSSSYFLYSRS